MVETQTYSMRWSSLDKETHKKNSTRKKMDKISTSILTGSSFISFYWKINELNKLVKFIYICVSFIYLQTHCNNSYKRFRLISREFAYSNKTQLLLKSTNLKQWSLVTLNCNSIHSQVHSIHLKFHFQNIPTISGQGKDIFINSAQGFHCERIINRLLWNLQNKLKNKSNTIRVLQKYISIMYIYQLDEYCFAVD